MLYLGIALSILLSEAPAAEPPPATEHLSRALTGLAAPTDEQPAPDKPAFDADALPPELAPWVAWISARLPERECAMVGTDAWCAWPGSLALDLGADGGTASLDLHLDRDMAVHLPGGPGTWPQQVRDGSTPVIVTLDGGRPRAWLTRGEHHLSWSVSWASRPNALPLPTGTGLVSLKLDGETVPFPLIDDSGRLRLGANDADGPGENRLEIEVSRRIDDGIPLQVTTRLELRASGAAREVALGKVTVDGTLPISVQADLPARLMPDGTLSAQLRPGTFHVTIEAVSGLPVTSLTAPTLPLPWPEQEVWAVKTDDSVRMVDLSGPVGVDPARTSLPGDWKGLPTFLVSPSTPLIFSELRRGEPEPPPNGLELDRQLWLDFDGGGLTVRDEFRGTMTRDWRLDTLGSAVLGHAADHGQDVVITTRDGQTGVEVRRRDVALSAESRVEGRVSGLPAVGWSQDVQSLGVRLHLPPGWTLLWASGVDALSGPGAEWTLFDLFYVLVLALALARLFDRRWGLVALAALALARHVDGAPNLTWILLTVVVALERVLPEGWVHRAVVWAQRATLLLLFSILVPLAYHHLRDGLYPQLQSSWNDGSFNGELEERYTEIELESPMARPSASGRGGSGAPEGAAEAPPPPYDGLSRKTKGMLQPSSSVSRQVDPKAVVQTGPGIPRWDWRTWQLSWSGPVSRDQELRLWLMGPFGNLLLALLRTALLLALALRLTGLSRWPTLHRAGPTAAVALALLALGVPQPALAMPDDKALAELEARLSVRPSCAPTCATAANVTMTVEGDELVLEAQVHAADITSWPLPGPAATWVPRTVQVDGRPTSALAKLADGAIHVRLSPGVHTLRAAGPVPATDALALDFPLPPQRLSCRSTAWSIEGVKADGSVSGTIQLVRSSPAAAGTMSENLPSWLEVERSLDLGIPWTVRTTVRRVGPATQPIAVRVPLLPNESLTDEAFEVSDGAVQVTLKRDEAEVGWTSALADSSPIVLTAPTGLPWTESWSVSCSPIFACSAEGPAPLQHITDERWAPSWRVWPGEQLTVHVTRPAGVEGQTVTVDKADLDWRPGIRLGEGTLDVHVRSSQGGRLPITLPEGAQLRQVRIDGAPRPIQLDDAGIIAAPLQPGATRIEVSWQQPHVIGLFDTVPQVSLGSAAVNVTVLVHASPDRWILALRGPAWGPVPLFWGYLVVVLIAAPLLARLPFAPLTTGQWALLGLGMTQVPIAVPMVVALVFLAFGWRKAHPLGRWWTFDLGQIALVIAALVGLGCLYAAIHTGLLVQPDMQVEGAGSSNTELRWLLDRTDGSLPTPTIVSLPLWTFRVAMLLWALWLAASLVRWAPWIWTCWSDGGLWRGIPPKTRVSPVIAEPPADGVP